MEGSADEGTNLSSTASGGTMVSVPLSIAISTVLLLHKVLIVLEVAGTASIDAGLRI